MFHTFALFLIIYYLSTVNTRFLGYAAIVYFPTTRAGTG